ncbi:DoxX family protein [Umezawaea beigongshangensis]|uniref:DoxX family protein n=1 Tax=Umezawaea beigongshangensis TaxID=2780383 RepID=UPI0018F257C5|nr:DoxX family protein [Umezawaea beigongshangensis]
MILRRLARPLLSAAFISDGVDGLRDPEARAKAAQPVVDAVLTRTRDRLPQGVPTDAATLVKVDAAVKVVAGTMLALNKFPRLSAALLAGSLIPTTIAAHPFWEHDADPARRSADRLHFLKNTSLLGGLLVASADTAGKPSLGWRARRAARRGARQVSSTAERVSGRVGDVLPSR